MNHWISSPWNSQRPEGRFPYPGNVETDIKVATFVRMFPSVAKKTSRLMAAKVSTSSGVQIHGSLRFLKKGK